MKRAFTTVLLTVLTCSLIMAGCGSKTGIDAIDNTFEKIEEGLKPKEEPFREDIAGRIGDHLVYSYNLFEGPGKKPTDAEKQDMIEYLEKVDRDLDVDLFITGHIIMSADGSHRFYAKQYVNGAVVEDVTFSTDYNDPKPNIVLLEDSLPPVSDIDTSGLVDAATLIPEVIARAETHASELDGHEQKGVYGDYLLVYDAVNDVLAYEFRVNEYSCIRFDAKTGLVLEEKYWNGAICD